jgi:hypothetical protein
MKARHVAYSILLAPLAFPALLLVVVTFPLWISAMAIYDIFFSEDQPR